jgi:hypothetical protein
MESSRPEPFFRRREGSRAQAEVASREAPRQIPHPAELRRIRDDAIKTRDRIPRTNPQLNPAAAPTLVRCGPMRGKMPHRSTKVGEGICEDSLPFPSVKKRAPSSATACISFGPSPRIDSATCSFFAKNFRRLELPMASGLLSTQRSHAHSCLLPRLPDGFCSEIRTD